LEQNDMPIGFDRGDSGGRSVETARPGAREENPLRELVTTVWTRWRTVADERVCPICGPLNGYQWPTGEGPNPPLHIHCRCTREFAGVVLSKRD
jgi:hypothetical protein